MADILPKNDVLWFFIARCIYSGVVTFFISFLIALARDFIRNKYMYQGPARSIAPLRKAFHSFSAQYRDTYFFYYVEFVRLTANILVCCLYVKGTYRQSVDVYASVIYRIFGAVVCVDLFLAILFADSAISASLTFNHIIDAFSIPSLFLAIGDSAYLNFAFLRAVSAYGAYGRLERRMFVHIFSSRRLLVKLTFQCITLFYTLAAGIQLLEIPGDLLPVDFRTEWSKFSDWSFLNSTYFIIVTLSTVGYGDFSPSTMQGRIYTFFIIVIGIVVFTGVISELGKQTNEARGSGHFVKNSRTRHIVITGTPTLSDLVHFLSEFYSDTRQSNVAAKVVVLVEHPNWSDTEWFQYIACNQFLQNRLQFLTGSPLNVTDLQRAKLGSADAAFILTSPSTGKDPYLQDTSTIMIVLAIRNARNDVPIYAQTILEDSNLQTFVALSTPGAVSQPESGSAMDKRATYPGLFFSVVQSESEYLQRGQPKLNRRYIQNMYRRHKQRTSHIDFQATPNDLTDEALRISEHVCLQEIHMALISGNIKANGVGTLLSNMYLDVQSVNISKEEPAWMSEYHMGAACSLVHVVIPDQLDGACVKEIANDLFHLGLLLIATSDSKTVHPRPVLSVGTTLRSGDLGIVLTYHQARYVATGFLLTALRYSSGSMRHSDSTSPLSGDLSSLGDKAFRDEVTGVMSPWSRNQKKPPSPVLGDAVNTDMRVSGTDESAWGGKGFGSFKFSQSADDLEDLAESENLHLVQKVDENWTSEVPAELKGHVIIAMEGSAPLQNLALLLRNLWRRDRRRSSLLSKRPRIVVIHPSVTDEFKRMFSKFQRYVFYVEGPPASRATWKKAKLSTANSVATVADYTEPWHISDARTIFTLLTLDCSTADDQDLFICSELIDEKSLEYLREPIHARRAGATLGESSERMPSTAGELIWPAGGGSSARPVCSNPNLSQEFNISDPGEGRRDKGWTLKFLETAVEIERQVNEQGDDSNEITVNEASTSNQSHEGLVGSLRSTKLKGHSARRPASRLASIKPPASLISNEARQPPLLSGEDIDDVALDTAGDPTNRPGAARARRSTLFSRSRYASGELLVQSSAITLLAREYIEPGFVKFFTNILGTNADSLGMKIRLVRIPKAMFDPERGFTCKMGRPLIRFNDVFRILVRLGVTPLGIYRSGSAPVLIPWKERRKRGAAITKELGPLLGALARNTSSTKTEESGRGIGNFVKYVVDEISNVAPAKMREQQAHEEVRGRIRQFFSNDDDDDSSEEFDLADCDDAYNSPSVSQSEQKNEITKYRSSPLPGKQKEVGGTEASSSAIPRGQSDGEVQKPPSRFSSWKIPRLHETTSKFVYMDEQSLEVPGRVKYMERPRADNLLPYVYTLPDPNTWCAETDGIFILCAPSFELPSKWLETSQEDGEPAVDSISSFPG